MLYQDLLKIGFLTGSQAFGTATPDSDYDIVFSIEDSDKVESLIAGLSRTESNYFSGFYIRAENKKINLIPVHPHDFLPWYLGTKAVSSSLVASGIKNPIQKYALFMGIVSLFKGIVLQRNTLDEYSKVKDSILRGDI